MKKRWQLLPGAILLAIGAAPLVGQVVIPHSFQAGETARAAQVNENFSVLKDAVVALQAQVLALQTQLAAVSNNTVMDLDGRVELVTDARGYLTVRFTGVNVQVVNGVSQETPNGVGNLIVGYNNARTAGWVGCSDGQFGDITACQTNGHVWAVNHKTGSHNLVVGDRNAYSQTGALLAGYDNLVNRNYASVTGGHQNLAQGIGSTVSGGGNHQTLSDYSSISGGWNNGTLGAYSNISGGRNNGTGVFATYSSVLGGNGQVATTQDQRVP
jgi:hypothetical protein